jgi:hypothetical protein
MKPILLSLFLLPCAAQSPDYGAIKRQTQLFETLITTAVKQRFDIPFVMLQETRGAYLEGYGVVFTLEVNLRPMRFISPFDARPYTDKEIQDARAIKLRRIKEAEALFRDLLRDHANGLAFLRPEESVAIVMHLFNTAEHRDVPTQLVVQAHRQAVMDAAGQKLTAAEFNKKLSVVTF